jgi:ferritin-like metal-binding protein YciE
MTRWRTFTSRRSKSSWLCRRWPRQRNLNSCAPLSRSMSGRLRSTSLGWKRFSRKLGEALRGKTCDAIVGIIAEGQELMKKFKGKPALDAGLLAAAHAVEHYEIARYGMLKTRAAELGFHQAVRLLDATLGEEQKTDETLTRLAEAGVNQHAEAA